MKPDKSPQQPKCQRDCLKTMMAPDGEILCPPLPLRIGLRITRQINPRYKRWILGTLDQLVKLFHTPEKRKQAASPLPATPIFNPKSGDLVRVRTAEEIAATLGVGEQLQGCTFMEEMKTYCNTIQKIWKPVTRAMDARQQKLVKIKDIVLLENVVCEGTKRFGPCDRSCLYFWRIEWLAPPGNPPE